MAVDRELKCMALWKCVFCVWVCVTSPWPLNFHELIKSIKMTSIERASDTHSRTYPGRHIYNPSHSGHSRDREQMKEKEKRERKHRLPNHFPILPNKSNFVTVIRKCITLICSFFLILLFSPFRELNLLDRPLFFWDLAPMWWRWDEKQRDAAPPKIHLI